MVEQLVDQARPTYDDIRAAADLIAGRVRRTPVLEVEVNGRPVTLKLELFQHSGSFKVRGAFHNALSASGQDAPGPTGLVAASGGNHGLAVAYVGSALGVPTRIFVPESAPEVKVRAIHALGAEVRQVGSTFAAALVASAEAAADPSVLAVHAYDSPGTVAGQGTLGLELGHQLPEVDTVLVAVGGGGLFAGLARALAGSCPQARVVGVEPSTCPTLHRALAARGPVDVPVSGVAADALGASRIGEIAFATARERRTTSLLVDDNDISAARQWLWREARVAAEPAGATALAALLGGAFVPQEGERVCVVVCGGNADPADLS